MNKNSKAKRYLEFVGVDSWDRPVYEDKNGGFWKDTNLGKGTPYLHRSCPSDDFDGEPDYPINDEYVLISQYKENPHRFSYMMLDKLRLDCKYYFGHGNRSKKIDIAGIIAEMKEIWNNLPRNGKPEWLTWEQILEYESAYRQETLIDI